MSYRMAFRFPLQDSDRPILTDINRKPGSLKTGVSNSESNSVDAARNFPHTRDAGFDPRVLPRTAPRAKNATPEQQTRYDEAYNRF